MKIQALNSIPKSDLISSHFSCLELGILGVPVLSKQVLENNLERNWGINSCVINCRVYVLK